jgi:cobalamin biosynthesis protein CobT
VDKRPEDTEDTEEKGAASEEDADKGESADTSREDEDLDSDSGDLPDIAKSELPDDITRIDEVKDSVRDDEYMPFTHHDHIIPNYNVNTVRADEIRVAIGKSTVSKRIKRYLKIVSKDSYSYGHKKGKLHVKNMHRIYTPAEQPKIFKRKDRAVLKTDTAVQIMLDCSGSMNGRRYTVGSACCVAISQCLTDLRIVHEVLGFSEYHRLWTYYFKTFEQNMSSDKLIRGLASKNIRLRENADGESGLYGAERLSERQERHKLMIVLSDGQPAGTYHGNGHWYLRMVSNAIEASGVNLIGIGIQTEAVERFYNNNYVVRNVSDLDSVLFEHLKKSLVD